MESPLLRAFILSAGLLALGANAPAFSQSFSGPANISQPTTPGHCVEIAAQGGNNTADSGFPCTGGPSGVSSVTNSDGSITFSPTTGAVVGSLNDAHANTFTAKQTISGASFSLSGNQSASGIFGTTGIRYANVVGTLNDTTATGTLTANYDSVFGGNTLTATSAVTLTADYGSYFLAPICSTNVTCTANYALGADTIFSNGLIQSNGNIQGNGNFTDVNSGGQLAFRSGNTILFSPATAQWQQGAADVAGAPVAQTWSYQSAAGVSNQAGANTTIDLSAGTGTGVAGTLTINGAPHSTTGTTKNAYSAVLTLNGDTGVMSLPGNGALSIGTNLTVGAASVMRWNAETILTAPADGQFKATNSAQSTTLFDFGVTTASVLTVTGGLKSTTAALNFPGLGTSSAGTTGTLCWITSTGLVNVDTTTTCLLSLEELKDICGPISGAEALADVLALKPFWGTWKKSTPEYAGDKAEQPFLGAHQVASVDKRLAAYAPNGALHGVRYQELTAVLVGAIKAQQWLIDALAAWCALLTLAVGYLFIKKARA